MKVKLLTMILLVIAGSSMAQSVDQENQEKYWKYRDQLKKRFMKIGKFSGESIPCSVIIPNRQYGEGADQSDGSIIQWRDATVTLGYYFIVLSTEYKLLSENSQDVQPTLNELYYAMQAFNRLDMVAEGYLGGDMDAGVNPSDLNGFFHRDDVRHEMTLNFENDPAIPNGPIQPDVGHPNQMRSDWDGWININDVATDAFRTEPYQPGSESLDQMTSILLGLRFIERMVPNVFVKPTEDDAGFFIHDECLAMIKRVVENLNDTEPNNFGQFSAKEWTLMQGEDETVHNGGSNCVFASYPITEMMKALFDSQESEMIGEPGEVRLQFREKEVCIRIDTDWDSQFGQVSEEFLEGLANLVLFTVGNYMLAEFIAPAVPSIVIPQATVWSGVHCVVGEPDCCEAVDGPVIIEIPNETIRKIWERLESNSFPMHAEGAGTTTFFTGDLIVKFDGLPNTLPPLTPVPVGEKMTDDDNVHIMLELALLGHTWGPEYVKFCSYPSELYHIPLLYDILHNDPINSNTKSQNYFRELLTLAPCAGPWADPYILSHRAEEWASANRLFHPGDRITGAKAPIYGTEENEDNIIGYVPDPEYRGYFPGIDYMLYYNAYHFTWANELPSYQKSTNCNCVEEITSESEMTNTFEVRRKFPDYKAKGIPIESYLAHDLDMTTAEGVLEVRNDLIICRENPALTTTLRIKDGATLNLYNGNKITVREGNKLVIQNGSHITVGISETDPQGDPNSYPAPEIILEANAELVISDSELNSISGIKIRLAEGAKLTVTDSEITLSAASDESGIYCTGCEWAMTNSTFVNEYALDNFSLFSDDAQLLFTDCPDLNFGNMHLTIADNSSLHADNCELTFHESEILTYNNVELRYDNCTLNLNDAGLRSLSTTILYQNNSDFNITNGGYIEMHEPLPQTIVSKYNYGSGDVHLTQSDSKILFDGAQLHIPAGVTFQPIHENAASGYIEFKSSDDHDLYTGTGSKFKLVGDGSNDVMLRMNGYADLWNVPAGQQGGVGEIILQDCKVDMTDNGRLWTDMKFTAHNVRFEDTTGEHATVAVWSADSYLNGCNFSHVKLQTVASEAAIFATTFSGGPSGFDAREGQYYVFDCVFTGCDIFSTSLDALSSVYYTEFDDYTTAIEDLSQVELYIQRCDFFAGPRGVDKTFGKLTMRCNVFDGTTGPAIYADRCELNLRANDGGGYNTFADVADCIVMYKHPGMPDFYQGYNNFSGYTNSCIRGTVDMECTDVGSCIHDAQIDALNNHWGYGDLGTATPLYPDGSQSPYNVAIDIHTEGACLGGGFPPVFCSINVTDPAVVPPTECGQGSLTEKSFTYVHTPYQELRDGQNDFTPHLFLKSDSVDTSNPIIQTSSFYQITLDSALHIAKYEMEIYDSLGNDLNAVDMYHQILTSGLDRSNMSIRTKMDLARYNMKSALENCFIQNELNEQDNTSTFQTPVQQYVDVLNEMTDTELASETYKQQFYLEIDKAQLMRTLQQPRAARHIYAHLDDCELDSAEQNILNYWLQQVDIELSVMNQYMNGVSPDSIVYEVDTTSYPQPEPAAISDLYFGVWINSPTAFTFVNCGSNASYRNVLLHNNDLVVYPNPSHGIFNIGVKEKGNYQLTVLDATGRTVHSSNLVFEDDTNRLLDLSGKLSAGHYLLVLENGVGMMMRQVVLE